MAENKKSFILYADLQHTIKHLTDEQAGNLFKHILSYVNDENPVSDNPITTISFEPIKQQLKRDLDKWGNTREGRRRAGKASAEARKLKKEQDSTNSTNVKYVQQSSTNSTVNVNDNVNDNVNEKTNTVSRELIEDKHREFSKLFYEQLKLKGVISKSIVINKNQIDHIRKLETVDKIDWDDIKNGANYYFQNLDSEFMPEIQSTKAFRDKFDKLVAHKKRKQ